MRLPGVLTQKTACVAPPEVVQEDCPRCLDAVGFAESCPGGWVSSPALREPQNNRLHLNEPKGRENSCLDLVSTALKTNTLTCHRPGCNELRKSLLFTL